MKKIKDMKQPELYFFIIAIVAVSLMFGIVIGVIGMSEQAQEDLIKTNEDANVCYVRCPNDFQCFRTCFWAKTHDIGVGKID